MLCLIKIRLESKLDTLPPNTSHIWQIFSLLIFTIVIREVALRLLPLYLQSSYKQNGIVFNHKYAYAHLIIKNSLSVSHAQYNLYKNVYTKNKCITNIETNFECNLGLLLTSYYHKFI